MAYAVLGSLTQTIDHITSIKQYPLSDKAEKFASLRKQVVSLQKFLQEFPTEASSLETRIRDAANHTEDVLEHFMYEETRSRLKSIRLAAVGRATTENIRYNFRELEMVMEEIDSIAKEAEGIKRKDAPLSDLRQPSSTPSSSLPAPSVESFTVGLEKDLQSIKDLVLGDSPHHLIIPITGMGGIGKTTLAKQVYHDQSVLEKFDVRAWVTVSQNHKPEKIFADLLYSLPKEVKVGVPESDSPEDKLYKILQVTKFLIVLDDLWSEKAWNDIKKAFGHDHHGHGSRIVITTRDESVASHITSIPLHEMQFLNAGQSYELLTKKVFPNRECPSLLKKIGEDIATSCGGLPLAIVLVAGILCNVGETLRSWEDIAKDVHAAVDKSGREFEKIISLSYTYLPLHLRPSFLYMGGFPEDYEIGVSKLIKLWIAEGFVKDENEAEKYLLNLVRRSLALVTTMKSNGTVKSCNVHDLVRDLCKRKALDENYERRQSIAHPDLTRLARAYASTLRSVLSFQPNESSLGGLRKFKLLRVLDVVDTDAYSLPAPVFELFHLRYLAFGCPMEVPSGIARLQNLRALIIRPSKRLRNYSMDELYLPLEIWMMPHLTHLVSFFDLFPNPEGAASAMEKLLTLSVVKKLICTEEMMKMIRNLKKLVITYFGDKYQEDYQLHNLQILHQLEKLTLVLRKGPLVGQTKDPVFPETLKKLTLSGWRFPWDFMDTVVGSLPNLEVLKLRDYACEGDTWETEEGKFVKLKFLLIEASDLKNWYTTKTDFPELKRLVLHDCDELVKIPNDIGHITTLELIEVDRRNKSLAECVKQIQINQEKDYDNKRLQVRAL